MDHEVEEQLMKMYQDPDKGKFEKFMKDLAKNVYESLFESMSVPGFVNFVAENIGEIRLLAAKSNDPETEVLKKALTLYGLALDAREKGNRLAILDPEDVIVHEVVGFEPVEAGVQ